MTTEYDILCRSWHPMMLVHLPSELGTVSTGSTLATISTPVDEVMASEIIISERGWNNRQIPGVKVCHVVLRCLIISAQNLLRQWTHYSLTFVCHSHIHGVTQRRTMKLKWRNDFLSLSAIFLSTWRLNPSIKVIWPVLTNYCVTSNLYALMAMNVNSNIIVLLAFMKNLLRIWMALIVKCPWVSVKLLKRNFHSPTRTGYVIGVWLRYDQKSLFK